MIRKIITLKAFVYYSLLSVCFIYTHKVLRMTLMRLKCPFIYQSKVPKLFLVCLKSSLNIFKNTIVS